MARNRKANLVGTITATSLNVESITLISGHDVSGQANNAYAQANAAYSQGNSAYSQANSAYTQGNSAYSQANSAYADSNTRVLKSGDTMTGQLNISSGGLLVTGNSNFDSGTLFVNSVANRVGVGTTNPQNDLDVVSSGSYSVVSARNLGAEGRSELRAEANNGQQILLNAIDYSGIAETITNATGGYFIGTETTAPLIFRTNNIEQVRINSSGNVGIKTNNPTSNLHVVGNANITLGIVTNAGINAATVNATTINASTLLTNSGINVSAQAADAYSQANNAYSQANSAYGQANLAYTQANNAYTAANNSNLKSGGVITGTLNVTQDIIVGGNVYLEGNTTFINVATYSVEDSLIYMAANNTLTDSVDIGFVGAKNTSGTFSHTGFARDATDGKWKLFDGLADSGHVGNVIDFANTTLATLVANVEASSILLSGNAVATNVSVNDAYSQANSAYGAANNRVLKAGDTMTGQLNVSSGGLIVTGGNVGIGTISQSYKLHIRLPTTTSDILQRWESPSYDSVDLYVGSTQAYFGTVSTTPLAFRTNNTERMRIDGSGGNVGIGSTNPQVRLDLGTQGGTVIKFNPGTAVSSLSYSGFAHNDLLIGGIYASSYPHHQISFGHNFDSARKFSIGSANSSTFDASTIFVPTVTITSGGSVGIGTADPRDYPGWLTVDGGINIRRFGTDALWIHSDNNNTFIEDLRSKPVHIMINSVERFTFANTFNFGLNTTSPGASIHIRHPDPRIRLEDQNGGDNIDLFAEYGAGGTEFKIRNSTLSRTDLTIDGSGNLGVGITSTTFKTQISLSTLGTSADNVRDLLRLSTSTINSDFLDFFKLRTSSGSDWQTAGWRIQQKIDSTWMAWIQFGGSANPTGISLGAGDTTTSPRTVPERFTITGSGNVGIGITTPNTVFNIYGGTSGNKTDLLAISHPAGANAQPVLRFDTIPANNNVLGRLSVKDAGSYAGDMIFEVAATKGAASTTTTERMVIKNDGNVGIGTTNPTAKLDVAGSATSGYSLLLRSGDVNNGTDSVQIAFGYDNTANYRHSIRTRHNAGATTDNAIDFWLWRTSDAVGTLGSLRVMTIEGTGSVGVGNTSPTTGYNSKFKVGTASVDNYCNMAIEGGTESSTYWAHPIGYAQIYNSYGTIGLNAYLSGEGRSLSSSVLYFAGYNNTANAYLQLFDNKLHIAGDGKIGIGTTSPYVMLTIQNGNSTYSTPNDSNVPNIALRNTNNASSSAHSIVSLRTFPSGGNPFVSYDIEGVIGWAHGIDNADSDKFKINRGWSNLTSDTKLTIDSGGNVTISGTLTENSSALIKENIMPINNALNIISRLVGVTYDRKDGSAKERAGLIAEEVEQVLPNVVQKDNDGNPSGIQYTNLIAYLVESIKELKAEIDTLKKQNGTVS